MGKLNWAHEGLGFGGTYSCGSRSLCYTVMTSHPGTEIASRNNFITYANSPCVMTCRSHGDMNFFLWHPAPEVCGR